MKKLRAILGEHEAEAALITHRPDIRWACGFSGSNGVLVVRPDAAHFVTDGRYEAQARREVRGAEVHAPGYDLLGHIEEEGLFGPARRVLFQSDHVSVDRFEKLRELFPEIDWQPASKLLVEHVARKTEDEIGKIRAAQEITEEAFAQVLKRIRPGVTEREVAAQIVCRHLRLGAERIAFEPIVASGPNGALPHARSTDRRIEAGELVVIDMGCFVDGYASDMTRTVAVGEPGEEARAVYAVVREAQEAAVEAARAGMTTKALDAVARDVIEEAGYGDEFPHSLGHGIGLQVHKWPSVSYRTEDELPEGVVVTIEPGIYLPETFGVRIEDLVLLRPDGSERLTGLSRDLVVI